MCMDSSKPSANPELQWVLVSLSNTIKGNLKAIILTLIITWELHGKQKIIPIPYNPYVEAA